MDPQFRIKFWGTRGLVSAPSKESAEYGGNTPCMQVLGEDALILIDTGFGVSNLGETLMQKILVEQKALEIHIFYTHFHWDHIQGLPFFHPIYFPSTTLHFHSPLPTKETHALLDVLFDGSYSPFAGIDSMPSKMHFHQMNGPQRIGALSFTHVRCDHGWEDAPTYAYRMSHDDGASALVAIDHEARPGKANDALTKFGKGCDLVVHDAQFTDDEYKKHVGWGHSADTAALDNALAMEAGQVLLAHHHPERTDGRMNARKQELKGQQRFAELDFEFAREGNSYPVIPRRYNGSI